MGVVIKQSFWGTFLTYLGVIIGYVNTLYLRPEFFSLDEIGLFTLVTANAMMISPLCTVGMGGSYVRFYPLFKDSEKLSRQVFSFQFAVIIGANLIIMMIAWINSDWIIGEFSKGSSEYVKYLSITAIIVIVNSLFEHLFAFSSTILKVIIPSFLREVQLRLGAIILVLGYAGGFFEFDWAIKGLAINYTLALVLLFLNLIVVHKLRFDFSFSQFTREWRNKILQFSLYSMALAMSFAILNNVSYNQLSWFLGDEVTGIFSVCFFIGVIIEMPRRNMAKVIAPLLADSMANNNLSETKKIYKRGSITMSVIGSLLFIGIITNIQDLFSIIPKGDSFSLGFGVVLAVSAAKLILMAFSFGGEIINYSQQYKYNLIFQIIAAILLVVLNYFLIPVYGLNGVAISYFITILIHSLLKVIYIKQVHSIHPFMKSHFALLIISGITILIFYLFKTGLPVTLNIVIRSFLTTLFFTFLIYRFKISDDINRLIDLILSRLLKSKGRNS
ncbi:MAG: polysaccharide biosynthesis C-terminal domain-containing protein [Cyclobacteriaceae bacterium]